MKNTYFIKTFGCAMNHSDSERIASFFEEHDFVLSEKIDDAGIVLLNTCGIRQAAENRVYSLVNNLKKNRIKNDNRQFIVLTGCISHRKDVQKRLRDKVDFFFEIKNLQEFGNWLFENCLEFGNCNLEISAQKNNPLSQDNINYLALSPKHTNNFEAFVPIMTGCNNFCSYCVVPYARGREVSRPADEIIAEVKELIAKGYKHITLLGQNVNSYHGTYSIKHETKIKHKKHQEKEISFTDLLKKLNAIPGKFWITFVSSHPKDMSDELIEAITALKKVCEWVHLPVQAGDDEILRKMNRNYARKHYLKLIGKIKKGFAKHKPDALFSITSDIIVGFPAETKKQFMESANIMKKVGFDMLYFGQFSPRPGTVAWNMKDNVSNKEKERRELFLNEILKKTALENNKKYVGKKLEVLVEKEKNGFYYGKTRSQKNIKFPAKEKGLVGSFRKALVTNASTWNLEGE